MGDLPTILEAMVAGEGNGWVVDSNNGGAFVSLTLSSPAGRQGRCSILSLAVHFGRYG